MEHFFFVGKMFVTLSSVLLLLMSCRCCAVNTINANKKGINREIVVSVIGKEAY